MQSYIADEVWPHFSYGKNAVYQVDDRRQRDHGNAILSRYPILHWGNLNISTNSFEQRGILYAVVQSPEGTRPVYCFCLHLDLRASGRQFQLEKLRERILAVVPAGAAVLICGDMNDWSRKANSLLIEELGVHEAFHFLNGRHARTFPSWMPVLHLDRIYYRTLKLKSATVLKGAPWNRLSDHLALLADFDWP